MLTIHGGRFVIESASAYDPEIIINNFVGQGRNIVVVTFNYRLGLFGLGMLNGDNQDTNFGLYGLCVNFGSFFRKRNSFKLN